MNSTNPTVHLSNRSIVCGLGHPALRWLALLALLATIAHPTSTLHAQGTAFTYQGLLSGSGQPANGSYDIQFTLYATNLNGSPVAGPVTNFAVAATKGQFSTTVDFGPGVFDGRAYWLDVAVRLNGGGAFTELTPRQAVTAVPYAVMANSASNLLGTLPAAQLSGAVGNGQLANNSIMVNAGTGLSGGGTVPLGGSTTLSNAGVLSVTGNADITASTVNGAVTLGDTATSANTASTIVKRDASRNFSAGSITLSGNLNLPFTTPTAGSIYQGGLRFLYAYNGNLMAGQSAGNLTMTGGGNVGLGPGTLPINTSGSGNTAVGGSALGSNTSGNNNTACGVAALLDNGSGANNIALGYEAGYNITTGSNNIIIGNLGVAGDDSTIRIGAPGTQTNTFLAGIYGANPSGGTPVFVNAVGQLGTVGTIGLAQLPTAVLTNNASGVDLSGVFSGNGGGLTNLAVAQLPGGVLTNNQTGVTLSGTFSGDGGGLNNVGTSANTGGATVRRDGSGAVSLGAVRSTGLIRSGSETGTSDSPNPAGLVVRRINSWNSSAGQVVAVAPCDNGNLTLERDGTDGGFLVRYPANAGYIVVSAIGIDNNQNLKTSFQYVENPTTAGILQVYTDGQAVHHFECSFGITYYQNQHLTQVTLTRHHYDYYWAGTLMSTSNQ